MDELAGELASLLVDYRKGDGLNPKKENVLKWVEQFSAGNRQIILEEMIHICNYRYLTEPEVDDFLRKLIYNEKLTAKNPKEFWTNVSLLDIQKNGHSQKIMNDKFKEIVKIELGIDIAIDDNSKSHFIHLDDFLFTGNRLKNDLTEWFSKAPKDTKLEIIYMGYYKNGQYHCSNHFNKLNSNNIQFTFWHLLELENNPQCMNVSHVLWPTDEIAEEEDVKKFLSLQGRYFFRDKDKEPNSYCAEELFSSEKTRLILEKEFTMAGLKINSSMNDDQKRKYWKPLGINSYPGLGFGAMVFSYRNCPNNVPLAFWWGDWDNNNVWYPLFQRKTYPKVANNSKDDDIKELIEKITTW